MSNFGRASVSITADGNTSPVQEFVARVHSRGVVRKRVMPFRLGEARGASCRSSGAGACSPGFRPSTA
jgi:hypothetical protein